MRLIIILFFLMGCVKNSGDSNSTPSPGAKNNSNSNLISDKSSLFLGLNNLGGSKSGSITITNNTTTQTYTLATSIYGDSQFTITSNNCSNKSLEAGESCVIGVNFVDSNTVAKAYKAVVSLANGAKNFTIPVYAYSYNFNELDFFIEKIIEKQSSSTNQASQIYLGSWQTNGNVETLESNAVIVDALLSAYSFYLGNSNPNTFTTMSTNNINYQTENFSNWKVLDKSLHFFLYNESNTSAYNDDIPFVIDPNASVNNLETAPNKWSNFGTEKIKNLNLAIVEIINKNYKKIYGSNLPNYESTISGFKDSYKILTTDVSNSVLSQNSSILAQVTYLLNVNTKSSSYYFENSLKSISLLVESLINKNNTVDLQILSQFYLNHWYYDFDDIQDPTNPFVLYQNLKYNEIPFSYSNPIKPHFNLTNLSSDKLWWILDYNAYFTNNHSCRNIAYALLNLAQIYNGNQLTSNEKIKGYLYLQDGLLELKNYSGCYYDDSSKNFLSQTNLNNTYNENNGIGLILRAYHKIPDSIVSVDAKINIYKQVLTELSAGGSLDLDDPNSNPLYLAETLKAMIELAE